MSKGIEEALLQIAKAINKVATSLDGISDTIVSMDPVLGEPSLCKSINLMADEIRALGNNGASTSFGAIENLAMNIKMSGEGIQEAIGSLAASIDDRQPQAEHQIIAQYARDHRASNPVEDDSF